MRLQVRESARNVLISWSIAVASYCNALIWKFIMSILRQSQMTLRITDFPPRRSLLKKGAIASPLLPCGCTRRAAASIDAWNYGGLDGPSKWKGTCKNGRRQSPIDLPLIGSNIVLGSVKIEYEVKWGAGISLSGWLLLACWVNMQRNVSVSLSQRALV